jgi:hypothetical protein
MTSDALTRLVNRRDHQPGPQGCVDDTPAPDLAEEIAQLRDALVSNRRIGMAMGILMRDRDVDEHEAFAALRRISQNSNRKLRDVAEDVIYQRRTPLDTRRAESLTSTTRVPEAGGNRPIARLT